VTDPPAIDGAFARWLAHRAGEELVALRRRLGHGDPANLGDVGDQWSHRLIMDALESWRPGDAVLSEEGGDDPARLSADRVWIVDPLDGTREFTEPDRSDWAVHVALWSADAGLTAGAVALPAQHLVLATDQPPPYPGRHSGGSALRLAVSRSRPAPFLAEVAAQVGGELIRMGSAGAKVAAVVTGLADAYLHAGGQYEWDSAAPVAVASATGLHTSRIDGSALKYNQGDPYLPDLLVCRPEIADRLLSAVDRHKEEQR
jgi:3'(2'), 5'-bisphosphate nucleotidase